MKNESREGGAENFLGKLNSDFDALQSRRNEGEQGFVPQQALEMLGEESLGAIDRRLSN